MENKKTINIMIVDDHQMFLDGITVLISSLPNVSVKHIAKDGMEALYYLNKNSALDIIISDVSMPKLSGLELCKKVKEFYPSINLLILSMHDDTNTIKGLLEAGALGYILKNTGKEELFNAIQAVYQGETYFSDTVKNNLVNSMTFSGKSIQPAAKLSKREIEIIKLIAEEMTTNEIAEKLFISLHTVESHRKNILRKTNCRNLAGLMKYALKKRIIE